MADLTQEQLEGLVPRESSAALPLSTEQVTGGVIIENLPPAIGDTRRRQQALGEEPGVPFHEEGLPTWTDLMTKAQESKDEQINYLMRKFGSENVRLNDYQQPVVRIKNEDTGKMEDYVLDPHQLTVRNLTSLARFAPDVVGGILGMEAGGKNSPMWKKAIASAIGSESGGAIREIVAGAGGRVAAQGPAAAFETPIAEPLGRHAAMVPVDLLADLGLAGGIKSGQAIKGLGWPKTLGGKGINIPNPVGGTVLTKPAHPEFTKDVVEAARDLQSLTGIDPKLRGSELTGLPVHAMIEQYFERTPAGASPQIAARDAREKASKAIQNWFVDPTTLWTDEEFGRRSVGAIDKSIEPLRAELAKAKAALEAEKQAGLTAAAAVKTQRANAVAKLQEQVTAKQAADIMSGMNVSKIPTGVDLAPTGEMLAGKATALRDAAQEEHEKLYAIVTGDPRFREPVIPGDFLKNSLDNLLKDLPKVQKTVERPTGILGPTGEELTKEANVNVPIKTPIRPKLEELSAKLKDGTVSLNDLKQVRTDIGNSIAYGMPFSGYKEGRLKFMYKSLSEAIDQGLEQIGDPELKAAWKNADEVFKKNMERFEHKDIARLFRETDQANYTGPFAFTKKTMTDPDMYKAVKTFFRGSSPEMKAFYQTVKTDTLSKASNSAGLIDGGQLTRLLKSMKDQNPKMFEDSFGGRGNDFLRAAEQLGSWQEKVPAAEIEKLFGPAAKPGPPSVALIAMQAAQKKLNAEYQNRVIRRFAKGELASPELELDKFSSELPKAKLSDVKDVLARIEKEDPEAALQLRRKTIQNLLMEARRNPTWRDAYAKNKGEAGDLVNASGLVNALGRGDQEEKYKAILGPVFDNFKKYITMELAGEQRREVAAHVGMLAPGSAVSALRKALTPWEGKEKGRGMAMELGGLARDKVFSIAIADPRIQNWLMSPYALKDASTAIKYAIMSEPFIKGMIQEFPEKDMLSKTLSGLKVLFGTASTNRVPGTERSMSREELEKLVPK